MPKSKLLAAIENKNRGLLATEAEKMEILELVAAVEAVNPYPHPLTNALELLAGNWRLRYTSSASLLGIDRFPLVQLGEIYQYLDPQAGKLYNVAEVKGALGLNSIVAICAAIVPISDRRVGVKFNRSIFGLQSLLSYQSVDGFIERLNGGQKFTAVDFQINSEDRGAWLEIVYLDANMRIGRGNEGNIFILTKV
jgi:hypothetical protein